MMVMPGSRLHIRLLREYWLLEGDHGRNCNSDPDQRKMTQAHQNENDSHYRQLSPQHHEMSDIRPSLVCRGKTGRLPFHLHPCSFWKLLTERAPACFSP